MNLRKQHAAGETHALAEFASFRLLISVKAEERASSFPAAAEATSSDFKLDSFSSSETFSLSERSSASSDLFSFSACHNILEDRDKPVNHYGKL